MSLKIVSDYLKIADPEVHADVPRWIWAETINIDGVLILYVFRSPLLLNKPHHPFNQDVTALVDRYEVVDRLGGQTILDPEMMFGSLVWGVDMLHNGAVTDTPKLAVLKLLAGYFLDLDVTPLEVPAILHQWFSENESTVMVST